MYYIVLSKSYHSYQVPQTDPRQHCVTLENCKLSNDVSIETIILLSKC